MKSILVKFATITLLPVAMLALTSVLLVTVSGCASTKQTEDLLASAGFKTQPATTPEQQAHLKSLPAHKVTSVQRDGKQYFVYPDVKHNVLYIGTSDQYQEYQKLRRQQQMAEEQITPAQQMQTNFSVWGAW